MSKGTIDKKIQCLQKRIENLKIDNGCLRRRIANRENTIQEAAEILNAMKVITNAIKKR